MAGDPALWQRLLQQRCRQQARVQSQLATQPQAIELMHLPFLLQQGVVAAQLPAGIVRPAQAEHLLAQPASSTDRALITTESLGNGMAPAQPDQQIQCVELLN